MRNIQRLILISAVLFTAGYFFNALRAAGQTSVNANRNAKPPTSKDSTSKNKAAKVSYLKYCSKCHGADGRADTVAGEVTGATDFTDSEWQKEVDDARLITSITHGRGGMPAFEKKLTPEQVKILVAYIRAFKK